MADKGGEPRLTKLPLPVVQNEVQKVILEMHALDHRLASLQNAIGLKPAELHKDGRSEWTDTHELALWVAIERGREAIDTWVLSQLRWAARLPEGYPDTVMPPDAHWETKHVKAGSKDLKRRIGKRQTAGKWYRSNPGDTSG